jgi:ATP-dependent Clp protease protease subunit
MARKTKKKNIKQQMPRNQELLTMSQANLNALSLGYDFEHRAIYLFGPIDKMAAYRFIAGFKWLDRTPGPIHILLNSEGGDVDAGFSIFDCLRTANNPTIIEGMGMVASAAVPILLAGTVRFLNPETKVMIHNVSWDIEGGLSTPIIRSISDQAEEINNRYNEIVAERTGKSMKDVAKWCDEETCFTCAEAISLGFADRVLEQRAYPKNFNDGMEEVNGKDRVLVPAKTLVEPEAVPARKRKRMKRKSKV